MTEYVTLNVNVRNTTNATIKLNGEKQSSITVLKGSPVAVEISADGFETYKGTQLVSVTSTLDISLVKKCDCDVDIDEKIDEKVAEATAGLKDEIEGDINAEVDQKLEAKASVEALNEETEARQNADAEFESSLEASERSVQSLANELRFLEDRVSELAKTNPEVVTPTAGEPTTINDPTKDVIVQFNFDKALTVTAKSVEIKGAEITANAQQSILLNVTDEAALKDSTVACDTASNTNVVMIKNAQYITFRNMTFTGRTYNTIMTGQQCDQPIKVLTIENCEFREFADHVNIWAAKFADDAVVNIINCHFYDSDEQVLALSNEGLAKNITINMVNCIIDKCETGDEYEGFILCQDYSEPKTQEGFEERSMFKDMTINLTNVTLRGVKLTPENFKMGTGEAGQCLYVYGPTLHPYDERFFPTVNVM